MNSRSVQRWIYHATWIGAGALIAIAPEGTQGWMLATGLIGFVGGQAARDHHK